MKMLPNKFKLTARTSSILLVLALTGCDGMQSYEDPNERENGPAKGIFSGSDGEFAIYRGGN